MNTNEKIIAFSSGACGDVSCEHLVVSKDTNMLECLKIYRASDSHEGFISWLKANYKGRIPNSNELEIIDECD